MEGWGGLQMQKQDADDPWLQMEWGKVMLAESRPEGLRHLQVLSLTRWNAPLLCLLHSWLCCVQSTAVPHVLWMPDIRG